MKIIDRVLKKIEENREKTHNCVSFKELLPRFSKCIPGVEKAKYYCVTGVPSSGKTQFADSTYLYHPYDFAKKSDIEVDITYFSFEISTEAKILNGISRKLFQDYGIRISPKYLSSIDSTLPDEVHEKAKKVREYFADLEEYVTFYDEPLTPSQIYKIMDDKVKENGRMVYEDLELYENDKKVVKKVFKGYEPYNPDKYVIFICDHISLMQPDPGQNLHQALSMYSSNNVYFRNKFGVTIVNIQQQALEGSIEQFTTRGDNVVSKLEPKMSLLGDNRTLSRDYDIILGMFSPAKYEVDFYRGYKTKKFGDHCRFLSVLKNRDGISDKHVGLYFDGAVNYFEEFPLPENFTVLNNGAKADNELLYEKYAKGHVGLLDPDRQRRFNFL